MSLPKKIARAAADLVSGLSGYAAVRDWTPTRKQGEVALGLVAYSQINSYACGAVAGFQVVKSIYPGAEFSDFYSEVNPDPDIGVSPVQLTRALRQFGVQVSRRRRLTQPTLKQCIRRGNYVIVRVHNPGADSAHWVVAHGFGPAHILVAGNGVPWLHRRRIPWEHFHSIWDPRGNGLICREEE